MAGTQHEGRQALSDYLALQHQLDEAVRALDSDDSLNLKAYSSNSERLNIVQVA